MYLPPLAMLFITINVFSQIDDESINRDSLRLRNDTTYIRDSMKINDSLDNRDRYKRDSIDLRDKDIERDTPDFKKDYKEENKLDGGNFFDRKLYDRVNKIRYLFYIPSLKINLFENKIMFSELIRGNFDSFFN